MEENRSQHHLSRPWPWNAIWFLLYDLVSTPNSVVSDFILGTSVFRTFLFPYNSTICHHSHCFSFSCFRSFDSTALLARRVIVIHRIGKDEGSCARCNRCSNWEFAAGLG